MIKARYINHTLGMYADITQLPNGQFKVTEYDEAFGYNCGTKTFSAISFAISYCIKSGFVTRRDAYAA